MVYCTISTFLVFNCLLLAWCKTGSDRLSLWRTVPVIAWQIATAQILVSIALKKDEVTPRDSLGWVLLLNYLIYVTLPVTLRFCIKLSIATCVLYLMIIIRLPNDGPNSVQQVSVAKHL